MIVTSDKGGGGGGSFQKYGNFAEVISECPPMWNVLLQTCEPENVLYGEPSDADRLDHREVDVVGRLAVLVLPLQVGQRVERHADSRRDDERD